MVAINILGDINDNINKKLVIDNVKLVSSVYTLKQSINNELSSLQNKNEYFLSYNGIKLNDDKPLIEYGIKDNSNITLHYNLNDGNNSSWGWYIIFVVAFIIYGFLLSSGFIALVAKLYGYSTAILIRSIINLVLNFFGKDIKDSKGINSIINLVQYLIKYFAL